MGQHTPVFQGLGTRAVNISDRSQCHPPTPPDAATTLAAVISKPHCFLASAVFVPPNLMRRVACVNHSDAVHARAASPSPPLPARAAAAPEEQGARGAHAPRGARGGAAAVGGARRARVAAAAARRPRRCARARVKAHGAQEWGAPGAGGPLGIALRRRGGAAPSVEGQQARARGWLAFLLGTHLLGRWQPKRTLQCLWTGPAAVPDGHRGQMVSSGGRHRPKAAPQARRGREACAPSPGRHMRAPCVVREMWARACRAFCWPVPCPAPCPAGGELRVAAGRLVRVRDTGRRGSGRGPSLAPLLACVTPSAALPRLAALPALRPLGGAHETK